MWQDYDYKLLNCDKSGFDVLTYIWVVALPLYVLLFTSFSASDYDVEYVALFIPLAYIIEPTFSTKYVGRRFVSATIWGLALMVMWMAFPLWVYPIYVSVPIAWYVRYKKRKKEESK